MDGDALLRAMASGEVDKLAQSLPEEMREGLTSTFAKIRGSGDTTTTLIHLRDELRRLADEIDKVMEMSRK